MGFWSNSENMQYVKLILIIVLSIIIGYLLIKDTSILLSSSVIASAAVLNDEKVDSTDPVDSTDLADSINIESMTVMNPFEKKGSAELTTDCQDEYDDEKLIRSLMNIKTYKNIIVDGLNFAWFIGKDKPDFYKSLKLLNKVFKEKEIYFVIKNMEESAKTLLITFPNVTIVSAKGTSQVDDHCAIYLTSVLPGKSLLLSRDRYKDIINISNTISNYKAYGKHSEINELFKEKDKSITKKSFENSIAGISYISKKPTGLYTRKRISNNSSLLVFNFSRLF